ncbi:MAG TPA: insulinase family protein, partial [Myxococcota bacterium]|nr:insulinase family protein [Myxococcota bacterium]
SSRLYNELVRRKRAVNDAYAYAYTPRDPGLVMLGAGLKPEGIEEAIEALLREAYRMRHGLVTDAELDKAKTILLSDSAYQRETMQGQARKLGFFEVVAGDYAFEDAYLDALRALSAADIQEVATRYLTATPALVVQVPEAGATVTEAGVEARVRQAFAASSAPARQSMPRGPLGVSRITLPSGATLLVREEESPVVAIRAVALGGQRWEKRDTAGLSLMYASLLGLATQETPPAALAAAVARLGGSLSAFTGRNTVGLRGEFIAETAVDGLQLFCDALLTPAFHEGDFVRERDLLLERLRTREDNPAAVAFDLFAEALFPTHPYGMRSLGTVTSLEALRLDHVRDYHSQYTSPDKLVVSVVGGIDAARVVAMLEERVAGSRGQPLSTAAPMDPPPRRPAPVRYS